MRLKWLAVLPMVLLLSSCAARQTGTNPPGTVTIEKTAYNTIVAAKAFLDNMRDKHPECQTGATSTLCVDVRKAVAAKDLLISALQVYCSGPEFEAGGSCQAPTAGTPKGDEALAKLKAAIANYDKISADIKAISN